VNGDGFADIIVAAHAADINGYNSGAIYVVFGEASGFDANFALSGLDGANGFRLAGEAAGDLAGRVSSAGDANGDGYDDFIIGVSNADPNGSGSGASYLVFGASAFAADIDLSALDGSNGFKLSGELAGDGAGMVSGAGDVDGDGYDDLIIGAPGADHNGAHSGTSYVIFGRDFNEATDISGTAGHDSLAGTSAAEVLVAGRGADTMTGNGGADVFRGGQGDDLFVVSDDGFFDVDGGTGSDTLTLGDAGFELDLTAIADSKTTDLEVVDLNAASGAHTLTLSLTDLLNLSDTGNTLTVEGGGADVVEVTTGTWTDQGVAGDYHVYRLGAAELRIHTAITDVDITL
jgi:hypothetical protein